MEAEMPKTKTRIIYRDSVNGEIISKQEAERRPRETEKERVHIPSPAKKKK
jgi:hypothetical protein